MAQSKSFLQEVAGGKGSKLVALHVKALPVGKLLTISRNSVSLPGKVPPPKSARPEMSKQEIQKVESMVIVLATNRT